MPLLAGALPGVASQAQILAKLQVPEAVKKKDGAAVEEALNEPGFRHACDTRARPWQTALRLLPPCAT